MITYTFINDIPLCTGDLICTTDGQPDYLLGEMWHAVGHILPGAVDHIAVYVGPGGRCVEAAALGVTVFEILDCTWDAQKMLKVRGWLADNFHGVAYPLAKRGLSTVQERAIREDVAAYCLAQVGKPYNVNFLNIETERAFYCSQLAYKAYRRHGIDLNFERRRGLLLPGSGQAVFPQEIWDGCVHVAARHKEKADG